MKRLAFILSAMFLSVGLLYGTAFSGSVVGIGFEFGTNFIADTDGETGASRVFNLNFDLSDDLAIGYYHENVSGDDLAFTGDISALQVRHRINDLLQAGVRFGNAVDNEQNGIYAAVFGTVTAITTTNDTFSGSIDLNLGYDFLPDFDEDLIKVGLTGSVKF